MNFPYRVGLIGLGHLSQSLLEVWIRSKIIRPHQIIGADISTPKMQRAVEYFGIRGATSNEEVVEMSDILILSIKPQDFSAAVDPLRSLISPKKIVVSLMAGISYRQLQKKFPEARIVRLISNLPSALGRGVLGYMTGMTKPHSPSAQQNFLPSDSLSESSSSAISGSNPGSTGFRSNSTPTIQASSQALDSVILDLFGDLGFLIRTTDEDQLEGLTVACSSGVGFVYEIMIYFQDWLEERGFDPEAAKKMVMYTFWGTAALAEAHPELTFEELQMRSSSKKGVTVTGLESLRELEVERALRMSFEKAALRNQELAKG